MLRQTKTVSVVLCFLAAGIVATATLPEVFGQNGPKQPQAVGADALPLGAKAWKLDRLNTDPLKLNRVAFDRQRNKAIFVTEFTRELELLELVERSGGSGGLKFQFKDEDGAVLQTIYPTQIGKFSGDKGAILKLELSLPQEDILETTVRIEAVNGP